MPTAAYNGYTADPNGAHGALPGYYDFETSDNFLGSLLGAVSSLLPSSLSGEEAFQPVNTGFGAPGSSGSEWELENMLNGENNGPQGESGITFQFSDTVDPNSNPYPGEPSQQEFLQLSSMLVNSYSQASSLNGVTPVSHPLESSTHTLPETNMAVKHEEDSPGTKIIVKGSKVSKPLKKDKNSHNMIEKKYRTNINSKISMLRDAVPALRIAAGSKDISIADLEGLSPASKLNKASVLTKATEYIKHLEHKNEVLKNQNFHLQRLIQEANMRPQQPLPVQQTPQIAPQQGGFGFVPGPNEQSYNATPVQQSYSNNFYNHSSSSPQQNNANMNKYLLGGMGVVVGTSMFGGDGGDFRGMSSLPIFNFLPYSITHPSPLVVQLFLVLKTLLLFATIASFIYPSVIKAFSDKKDDEKTENASSGVWTNWILVSMGVRLPVAVENTRKDQIVASLLGKTPFSLHQLLSDYLYLSSSEQTLETCVLNLIVGVILIVHYPVLGRILNVNMSLKGSLVTNLDYAGDDESLKLLNQLIKKVDGVAFLGSETLVHRLVNLAKNRPINSDINDGQNHVKYVEFLRENANDYYGVIYSWRLLELTHHLNLTYLKTISSASEDPNKVLKQILQDTEAIAVILKENKSKVSQYFDTFMSVFLPEEYAIPYQKSVETTLLRSLETFKTLVEGQELTDHEIVNTSDEEEGEETPEMPLSANRTPSEIIGGQKRLISSLNLINEEQYIALTSSLVLYHYNHNPTKSRSLLKHLAFSTDKLPLSLLAFTALLKVLVTMVQDGSDGEENAEVLDQLARITKLWINDENKKNFMTSEFRGDLSHVIVAKSLILNGEASEIDD